MTQDILTIPIEQWQSPDYYADLLAQVQSAYDHAKRMERRYQVQAKELAEVQANLQSQLVMAWGDSAQFQALSESYNAQRTLFDIAPHVATHWQKRARDIFEYRQEVKNQRDFASTRTRQEEAQRLAEQKRQQRIAEQDAQLAERRKERDAENAERIAEIQARNKALYEQEEEAKSGLFSFLNKIVGD